MRNDGDRHKTANRAVQEGAPKIDFMPKETRALLINAPTRTVRVKNRFAGFNVPYLFRAQIYAGGKWLCLGVTSLYDDVATGECTQKKKEVRYVPSKLLAYPIYGARIHSGYLSVITHMTDG